MKSPERRRIDALGSLSRVQDGRVDRAKQEHAQWRRRFDEAEVEMHAAIELSRAAEGEMRVALVAGTRLSLESLRRTARHLEALHLRTREVVAARDELGERLEESRFRLLRAKQEREGTERLRKRAVENETRVRQRREANGFDEAWLLATAQPGIEKAR